MIEMLTILGFVVFAVTSVFGTINLLRQIKRLPNDEN
jgi:hypothetical protein